MKKDYPPAFNTPKFNQTSGNMNGHEEGMTLRDYFAAKAIQSLITKSVEVDDSYLVKRAYQIADEMLKQRTL